MLNTHTFTHTHEHLSCYIARAWYHLVSEPAYAPNLIDGIKWICGTVFVQVKVLVENIHNPFTIIYHNNYNYIYSYYYSIYLYRYMKAHPFTISWCTLIVQTITHTQKLKTNLN